MEMMKMLMGFVVVAMLLVSGAYGADDTVAKKCSDKFQKVAVCLNYATGKAATPTKECCDTVTGIKESEPECLCYLIKQANSGSPEMTKMGIQVAKLLQLPSACKLQNASASNCPALLGLAPNSPDAAIFTNGTSTNTTTTTPAAPTTTSGLPAPDTAGGSSYASMLVSSYAGLVMAVVLSLTILV